MAAPQIEAAVSRDLEAEGRAARRLVDRGGGGGVPGLKALAWWLTGSVALYSDALESSSM